MKRFQIYWNHITSSIFFWKFTENVQNTFSGDHLWRAASKIWISHWYFSPSLTFCGALFSQQVRYCFLFDDCFHLTVALWPCSLNVWQKISSGKSCRLCNFALWSATTHYWGNSKRNLRLADSFNPIQDGHFWGYSQIAGSKKFPPPPPPSLKPFTHILQWWNLAQLYLT